MAEFVMACMVVAPLVIGAIAIGFAIYAAFFSRR